MTSFNVEPISHTSPYRRIDLNPVRTPMAASAIELMSEVADLAARRARGERIWAMVKQTAEGCNAPVITSKTEVCADGWDAA